MVQLLHGLLYFLTVPPSVLKARPQLLRAAWALSTLCRLGFLLLLAASFVTTDGVYGKQMIHGTPFCFTAVVFTLLEVLLVASIQPVRCQMFVC